MKPASKRNYAIGVSRGLWGVIERYEHKVSQAAKGDHLLLVVGGLARSLHRIESGPFKELTEVWPPYEGASCHGSKYPWRVRISRPIVESNVRLADLTDKLDLTKGMKNWSGAVMGANGVFNPLSQHDATLIEAAMRACPCIDLDDLL